MARPSSALTTTDATSAATTSNIWKPDTYVTPFNVGVMTDVTGTVNFDIQITLDDPDSASPLWIDDPSLNAKTADTVGSVTIPCRGMRVIQNTGNGSTRTIFVQAGT